MEPIFQVTQYADILTAIANSSLKKGVQYKITDINSTDLGVIVTATENNQLAKSGQGGFLNADWQHAGDYSGVAGFTGFAVNSLLGQWRTTKGTIDYAPKVTTYFNTLSGIPFSAPGNILTGNTNASTAEVLALGTTITLTVVSTAGMSNGDAVEIRDIGAIVLQTGVINTVVDGTHLLIDTLSGAYFDASQAFFDVNDTTALAISLVSDIQYGMDIKVTSGDWNTETSFTDGTTAETANTVSISFNVIAVGDTLTDSNSGATSTVHSNSGNGTSFATLAIWNIEGLYSDLDLLVNGSGATAYQVGSVFYSFNPVQGDIIIDQISGIGNGGAWSHYQKTTNVISSAEPQADPTNWTLLPSATPNLGYITKWDAVSLLGNNITSRHDEQLVVYMEGIIGSIANWRWGRASDVNNKMYWGFVDLQLGGLTIISDSIFWGRNRVIIPVDSQGTFNNNILDWQSDCKNNIYGPSSSVEGCTIKHDGEISANDIGDSCTIADMVLYQNGDCSSNILRNSSRINSGTVEQNGSIGSCILDGIRVQRFNLAQEATIRNLNSTTDSSDFSIGTKTRIDAAGHFLVNTNFNVSNRNITLIDDHTSEELTEGTSTMSTSIDPTSVYVGTVITLPSNYDYIGVFKIASTSISGGNVLSQIQGAVPTQHPFSVLPLNGITVDVLPIAIGGGHTGGDIISASGAFTLTGRTNGGDIAYFQKSGGFIRNNSNAIMA